MPFWLPGAAGLLLGLLPTLVLCVALRRARFLATHDDVTGLPNRRAALRRLRRVLHRGDPHGLVLLDLNRFKTVNDTYGHEAGNQLLTQVAALLAALPAPVVLAARLSGDEFLLLVRGRPYQVAAVAHGVWRRLRSTPLRVGGHRVPVAASVGYSHLPPGITAQTALHEADLAMYRAKAAGGGVHGPPPDPAPPERRGRCRDWPRH